ncbi:MAG: metal-dependent hydrolase [Candidatus Thorarchaeota archaeon]
MDFFTHLVFGALMYLLFLKEVTFDYFFLAVFFAILPDLDVFISPLKRIFKSNYLEHRAGSHSYIIGIIIAGIIGSIYSIITQKPFIIVWSIGIIFYGIHVSLDMLTTTKIPFLFPLSKKEHCFYVEKAGSSFTLLTSWIFITTLLIIYFNFPDITLILLVINGYTYFTISYYVFRILTKIWVSLHLTDSQKYFPGVLPFYFYIFEKTILNDNISLHLEKKSHFGSSKVLFENTTNLSIRELDIFNKGVELCKESYYYSKWTVLPRFSSHDGLFSIKFFFLEPMVRSRAMYIQYDFDLNSEILIGNNQSFGHF